MKRQTQALFILFLACLLGCTVPPPGTLPLGAGEAQHLLDTWNPQYCKVVEFYGLYPSGPNARVAYVLVSSPGNPALKPMVYEASFHLLTRPDGKEQWFLVSLLNHTGGLTPRQGWDNLMRPVNPEPPAPAK